MQRGRRIEGASEAAGELVRDCDVIDLHVDSFIWTRVFGYDLRLEHRSRHPSDYLGQADLPRLRASGVDGAFWSVTTNPFRSERGRRSAWKRNAQHLLDTFPESTGARWVRNCDEYRRARSEGHFAGMLAIQGGNALGDDPAEAWLPDELLRVTLVHLTSSRLGGSSSPLARNRGLGPRGAEWIERLDAKRVFIDLAHASKRTFWDAIHSGDRNRPRIVSHSGISGVHRHWRNLDDNQIRAVAETGGVVGVIFHSAYLRSGGRASVEDVANHLLHGVEVGGEDCLALGSDWDGAIRPALGLSSPAGLPGLVDALLRRRTPERVIRKILGGNVLACLGRLRPTPS